MIFSESNTFFHCYCLEGLSQSNIVSMLRCCFDLIEWGSQHWYCCRILPMRQQPETSATVLIQHNKDNLLNEGHKMVKIQASYFQCSKQTPNMHTVWILCFAATTTQIGISKRCWWFGRWMWKHLQEASQPEWRCSRWPTGLSFLYTVFLIATAV